MFTLDHLPSLALLAWLGESPPWPCPQNQVSGMMLFKVYFEIHMGFKVKILFLLEIQQDKFGDIYPEQ